MIVLYLLISISTLCVANEESIPGCGSLFTCFATPDCGGTPAVTQLVELLQETVKIPCSAVVKLHGYSKHHAYIELLTFDQAVKTIKFKPHKDETLEYVCQKTTTAPEGTLKIENGAKIRLEEEHHSKATEPTLRCSFFAKSKDVPVFGSENDRNMQLSSIGGAKDYDLKKAFPTVGRCNPPNVKYSREDQKSERYYSKVNYKLGAFTCEKGSRFKFEYLDKVSGKYTPVNSPICELNEFKMDAKNLGVGEELYIRCYTDAAFACNYPLLFTTGKQEMDFKLPELKSGKRGFAKCPASHKYLVVGKNKPILDSEIKCKNHGRGVMKWTTSEGKRLAATGPEIHCTDKLTCKPISLTAVKMGFLKESVPTCYDGGKLSIKDKGETFNDFYYEIKCDTSDGMNKFNTTAGHRNITDETVFECAYSNEAAAISAQNKQKVTNVSIVMVVGIVIAIPLTIFLINFTCYKIMVYKNNKKTREDEEREYNLFIAKKGDEKNANKDPMTHAPAKLITDPAEEQNLKYMMDESEKVSTPDRQTLPSQGYLSTPDYQKSVDYDILRRKKYREYDNYAKTRIARDKVLKKKKQDEKEMKALAEAKKLL